MDIIVAMLGIVLLWGIGTIFGLIGVSAVLSIYSDIKKIPIDDLFDFDKITKYSMIIGAIFVLAFLVVKGEIL